MRMGLHKPVSLTSRATGSDVDLDAFLHPGRAFQHPLDVVHDSDLTLSEKRAILASWASDACAIEAAPELRINASGHVICWDDIMDALRLLDADAARGRPLPRYKRVLARRSFRAPRRGPQASGQGPTEASP